MSSVLKPKGKEPLYYQLYQSLIKDMKQGVYQENEKLPSKRALSDHLGLSLNTIDTAYQMLVTEGYVRSVPRSGFYVNPLDTLFTIKKEAISLPNAKSNTDKQADYTFDFSTNSIDVGTFPYATWAKLSKEIMYAHRELIYPGHQQGDACLRQTIADYLHKYRAVRCTYEQIIVGAGVEYLIMVLNVLLEPNSIVGMENPGYPKAYQTITNCGRTVEPIAVTDTGIDIAALRNSRVNVAYITPSHQFPTGVVMPIFKRMELLSWANEQPSRFVIEDDYDSELKYVGKPIPSLQGTDTAGKVAYLGTFSRSIAPSIRIAYVVLPPALLEQYKQLCSNYSSTVSRFEQHTLYQFMKGGHFERNINRNRTTYRKRRDALVAALKSCSIANQLEVIGSNAGLHFLLRVNNGLTEPTLIARAKQAGICIKGLSSYYLGHTPHVDNSTVLLGFAQHSPEEIQKAVDMLAKVWQT